MSIGLSLSGGGAKGAAHIGVLQALADEGIEIDYIAGTSSGSIVATLFAAGYKPKEILNLFNNYCKYISDYDKKIPFKLISSCFTGRLNIQGLVKGDNLENLMRKYCYLKDIKNIMDIEMPIVIPAVDITTGEIIYFTNRINRNFDDMPTIKTSADIASIVRASCSFPGIFVPKVIDDKVLVDGGVRDNSPNEILKKMGADKIISVEFEDNKYMMKPINNIIDITLQSFDILSHQASVSCDEIADVKIVPQLNQVSLLECNKSREIAKQGYIATKKSMNAIKELLV
ncbi:MAG: patatin-like phospholipase family protein [Clostridia bacterium]